MLQIQKKIKNNFFKFTLSNLSKIKNILIHNYSINLLYL